MNGLLADLPQLVSLSERLSPALADSTDTAICVPATLIGPAKHAVKNDVLAIGAQDCHSESKGAFTGDISAQMLTEAGASYIIVGHSERRQTYSLSDIAVCKRAQAVLKAGAIPIICIGETQQQREAGQTLKVIIEQLAGSVPNSDNPEKLVIAYEPIWAIGTGLTANAEQIAEVHGAIRAELTARFGAAGEAMRILYGGSMKAGNAEEILAVPNVDGGLVGGASLCADDFLPIVLAAAKP